MLTQRASKGQTKAFTAGFLSDSYDESQQARQTAMQLEVDHNTLLLTESHMLDTCADVLNALDQPTIDGINTYHISRAVKDAGITVALSGLGGDEVFCGYKHFRTLPYMDTFSRYWEHLPISCDRLELR